MWDAWMVWIGIGIICMIIEIFTPGFFFMSIGVGAIFTGILSLIVPGTTWQILICTLLSFIVFLFLRKFSKKIMSNSSEETNIFALKGKTGKVIKEIPSDGRGYVKIGGEEWSAVSENNESVEADKKVEIIDIDGNKLIVKEVLKEEK